MYRHIALCLLSFFSLSAPAAVITLAIAGPMSGPSATFGAQLWQGGSMAVEDINRQLGPSAKNTFKVIRADDVCEPKQAVSVANRLVDLDDVAGVVGHFCSSATIPASEVYADASVIMITPASTNPRVTERGMPTVFRVCGRDDQQGEVAARFIHDTLKAKHIAIIHDKDAYGLGLASAVRTSLKKLGNSAVLFDGITRGEQDFNALATKLRALHVDMVYFGGHHVEAGLLLRQMRQQGLSAHFMSGDSLVSNHFITAAGGKQFVKGVYMTFGRDPASHPESHAVIQRFQQRGITPEGYTLYTYAAVQVIAAAMQATDSTDGETLAHWLHQHSVNTVLGKKQWDSKGDLLQSDYVVYQWDDKGHYHPVTAS